MLALRRLNRITLRRTRRTAEKYRLKLGNMDHEIKRDQNQAKPDNRALGTCHDVFAGLFVKAATRRC